MQAQENMLTASHRTLGTELKSRSNNFDFIRLAAAFLVIVSHSYPITWGKESLDPLQRATGYTSFGELAVAIFFIISGLLVARSFISDPKPLAYLKKRSLRIFPGLIVCTAFCLLVVGPLFTSLPIHAYLTSRHTFRFIRNAFMWPTFELPGVFTSHPLPAVNGSLWSLPFEFMMYLVILGLGMTRTLKRFGVALTAAAFLGLYIAVIKPFWTYTDFIDHHAILLRGWVFFYKHAFVFKNLSLFGFLFLAGTLLLLFKDRVRLDWRIAAACVGAIAAFCFVPSKIVKSEWGPVIFSLCLPYPVLYIAFVKAPYLQMSTKWGDFSYGVYLYAFPVQQMVLHFERGRRTWMSFPAYVALCSAITLVLAVVSWFFVEKPMLKLKKAHPLSPVLRGEGRGEGLSEGRRDERNSAFDPSPQPSPLSTGERGPDSDAVVATKRIVGVQ